MRKGISANSGIHLQQAGEESRNFVEWNHVRTITQSAIGLWMCFEEDAVSARSQRRARQHRRELALPARFISAATWQLNRMGRIKDHGETERTHDRHRTHVRDEVIVAE